MRPSTKRLVKWLSRGALVLSGAVIGWFANHYMDYRTAYKEALSANYEHFDNASAEVQDSLRLFGDVARGSKSKTNEDVSQLQTRLLKAVGAADDLQRRLNGDQKVIDSYHSAAMAVKHASEQVSGPADGKPLVLAVNDYLLAEKNIRDAVIKEHNGFLF